MKTNRLLVKIKSNSTKEVTRYKTDRDIHSELKHLEDIGVNVLRLNYFDETQSFGNCKKVNYYSSIGEVIEMNSSLYESYKVMESNEGQAAKTIPSYEVSEMMEKEHWEVLRMLEGYEPPEGSKSRRVVGIIPVLTNHNIEVSKYFIKSTYPDTSGKVNKCYECTRLGCDLLANKMTGEKGILFTAKYVERFNEMIENPFLNASKELQAIFMIDRKQQVIESRVGAIEEKMTVDYELAENLRTAVNTRAVHLLEGKHSEAYKKLSKKLFSELYRDIKGAFKVNSYKNISLKNYDKALSYIEKWKPSLMLQYAIQGANGQVKLDEMECVTNG